jgi:S1-C subfamily serine protease/predicted esterase
MSLRRVLSLSILLAGLAVVGVRLTAQPPGGADDLNEVHEKVMKEAVRKVAPSVVQILTQGGTDMVVTGPKGVVFRKALGPTTGVIVDADGYVISSAFNFINNPTTILVAVPGHKETFQAKRIATDKSRMLTLLRLLDAGGQPVKGLPVPAFVPEKDLREGQWSLALGRTLDLKRASPPSVSIGIISALGRIWGKAIQVDAKTSPVNYGGPIIDVEGRVQGIIVPASPRGEEETAGFEWYDSGIGFAIPMEHIIKVALPRLKEGKDLKKGLLGVAPKSPDIYGVAAEVQQVLPNSAAARAGLKAGDTLVEIDGQPITRQAHVLHLLGPKYEGDKISLKYKRGEKVTKVKDLVLVGNLEVYAHPFLGILPMRDDPKLGVEIRYVYPKSPADTAGLKAGDRIVKVGAGDKPLAAFKGQKRGRDELFDVLNGLAPGAELKLEVLRKGGKTDAVTVKLAAMPGTTPAQDDELPGKLPEVASLKKALAPLETADPKDKQPKVEVPKKAEAPKKAETGLLERTTTAGGKYWIYVHEDYDPNVAHALVIWLHPPRKNTKDDVNDFTDAWEDYCKDNHIIMVGPKSDTEEGWVPSDVDFVLETARDVLGHYTIDRQRVVAHGMGVGGQMAVYLGFTSRNLIRGVATTGAVVTSPKDNVANERLAFFLSAGDRDPLAKAVAACQPKLMEHRLPSVYREIPNRGREYLDEARLRELVRWIDALDRQ